MKTRLIAAITPSGMLVHARTPRRVDIGSTVHLTIPPERVLVYPHEAAA